MAAQGGGCPQAHQRGPALAPGEPKRLSSAAFPSPVPVGLCKRLCGAANQAAEMAWTVPCPLLVFPCLFEELAGRYVRRCARLVQRSGQPSRSEARDPIPFGRGPCQGRIREFLARRPGRARPAKAGTPYQELANAPRVNGVLL